MMSALDGHQLLSCTAVDFVMCWPNARLETDVESLDCTYAPYPNFLKLAYGFMNFSEVTVMPIL